MLAASVDEVLPLESTTEAEALLDVVVATSILAALSLLLVLV